MDHPPLRVRKSRIYESVVFSSEIERDYCDRAPSVNFFSQFVPGDYDGPFSFSAASVVRHHFGILFPSGPPRHAAHHSLRPVPFFPISTSSRDTPEPSFFFFLSVLLIDALSSLSLFRRRVKRDHTARCVEMIASISVFFFLVLRKAARRFLCTLFFFFSFFFSREKTPSRALLLFFFFLRTSEAGAFVFQRTRSGFPFFSL